MAVKPFVFSYRLLHRCNTVQSLTFYLKKIFKARLHHLNLTQPGRPTHPKAARAGMGETSALDLYAQLKGSSVTAKDKPVVTSFP